MNAEELEAVWATGQLSEGELPNALELTIEQKLPTTKQKILFSTACCLEVWSATSTRLERFMVQTAEESTDDSSITYSDLAALTCLAEDEYAPDEIVMASEVVWLALVNKWHTDGYPPIQHIFFSDGCRPPVTYTTSVMHRTWGYKGKPWRHKEKNMSSIDICTRQLQIMDSFVVKDYPQSWKSTNTQALAQHIYSNKAFHEMTVLADMLEENGCTDVELLTQLRDVEFPHYRGSYIIEFLK